MVGSEASKAETWKLKPQWLFVDCWAWGLNAKGVYAYSWEFTKQILGALIITKIQNRKPKKQMQYAGRNEYEVIQFSSWSMSSVVPL